MLLFRNVVNFKTATVCPHSETICRPHTMRVDRRSMTISDRFYGALDGYKKLVWNNEMGAVNCCFSALGTIDLLSRKVFSIKKL